MILPIRSDELIYPVKVDRVADRIAAAAELSAKTLAWLGRVGICEANSKKVEHFRAIESGAFASVAWPDATPRDHQIISDALCGLAFAIDDMYDGDVGVQTEDCPLPELLTIVPRYLQIGDSALLPDRPLYRAIADLRLRLVRTGASDEWLRYFAEDVREWLTGVDRETRLKASGRIPTVDELLQIRLASAAVCVFANFVQLVYGLQIPGSLLRSVELDNLRRIATRIAVYANDLLSYTRESSSGHTINLLTSICHHRGTALPDAMQIVLEMHNRDTAAMYAAASRILTRSSFIDLHIYTERLQQFVHGLLEWGLYAARYTHELLAPAPISVGDESPDIADSLPSVPVEISASDSGAIFNLH
ncbi:MAG: terpene synthase family protein [Proteobacteria bacterium]|nr:terpene synthase family protein [Pseudomonadota bacterium]